ncbi:MAG: hypothetical protein OEY09_00235 [Gammaproteobacteria bacterium]|nr:hypothetical protein [Gammaproteobacteria bacterium]
MKKHNTKKHQKGFFDLGLSFAILTLAGGFAYYATPEHDDRVALNESQIEVAVKAESHSNNAHLYE